MDKEANFFPETRIVLEKKATEKDPVHSLRIFKAQKQIEIKAKIILSADGLNGQFLEKENSFEMVTDFENKRGGVSEAVRMTLQKNRFPVMKGIEEPWQGTFPLSRKRKRVAGYKIFVIGDSAGYIEPFTGEGIARALTSAREVTEFVLKGIRNWNSRLEIQWQELYHTQMTQRQNRCRLITRFLRNTTLTRAAVRFLSWFPQTARPLIEEITS